MITIPVLKAGALGQPIQGRPSQLLPPAHRPPAHPPARSSSPASPPHLQLSTARISYQSSSLLASVSPFPSAPQSLISHQSTCLLASARPLHPPIPSFSAALISHQLARLPASGSPVHPYFGLPSLPATPRPTSFLQNFNNGQYPRALHLHLILNFALLLCAKFLYILPFLRW